MSSERESRLPPSQVEVAIGLVNYQEGSSVSRTSISKEVGTVSVFAFSRGEGLSKRPAPHAVQATGDFKMMLTMIKA